MAEHDNSYNLLFSHAAMVTDLLRGFGHEDWVQHDLASLRRAPTVWVERMSKSRHNHGVEVA